MNRGLKERVNDLAFGKDGVRLISIQEIEALVKEYALSRREAELAAIREGVLPLRYYRNLSTIGLPGQARLLESSVAIVGLGGLGGYVAEGLARLGVGCMVLIDGDFFEDHNLNRQILSSEDNLGTPKVEAAGDRISHINQAV